MNRREFIAGAATMVMLPTQASAQIAPPIKRAGPQHPTWLNDEPHRPVWKVAGVDYPVGINDSALPLKNPTKPGALPLPCHYDPVGDNGRGLITIIGNNVHLDGYDFSRNDCTIFAEDGNGNPVNGLLLTNCKFSWSRFLPGPMINASNLTMRYCEMDCINVDVTSMPGAALSFEGYGVSSPVVMEYCWIKNSRGILFSMVDGAVQLFRYNLFENIGLFDSDGVQHPNFFQWNGGDDTPCSAHLYYNSMFQNSAAAGSSTNGMDNGMGFVCASARFGTFVADHNVLRQSPDVPRQFAGINPDGSSRQLNEWASGPQVGARIVRGGSITIANNYCDPSPGGAFSGTRAGAKFSGNINMRTGASLDLTG
jgi:hypothetical protein